MPSKYNTRYRISSFVDGKTTHEYVFGYENARSTYTKLFLDIDKELGYYRIAMNRKADPAFTKIIYENVRKV